MFSFKKSNTKPEVPVIKTLPSTASTTYKVGDALVLSAGALIKDWNHKARVHLCMQLCGSGRRNGTNRCVSDHSWNGVGDHFCRRCIRS